MISEEQFEEMQQGLRCFRAVVDYVLRTDDGLTFLRLWNEGSFDVCRKEWEDSPSECYYDI